MTPAEAFALLRDRRIGEIAKGREVRELSTAELVECLRLYGCRIPRFGGGEREADAALDDWLDTAAGKAMLGGLIAKSVEVVEPKQLVAADAGA